MLNLEKMAKAVVNEFGSLTVDSNRCSKVRSGLSTCNACRQVCPTGGINCTDTDMEVDNCWECGLCAGVCPTGTFTWKSPSPLSLVAEARELVHLSQKVCIYCGQHIPEKSNQPGIKVPCLGSIPWECWLELLSLSDRVKVLMPEAGCGNCRLKTGEKVWRRELQRAEKMAVKKMPIVAKLETVEKLRVDDMIDYERRQFLASLFSGIKKAPARLVAGLLADDFTGEKKSAVTTAAANPVITERRQVLVNYLKRQTHLAEQVTLKLPVITENCHFCQACSTLCPQGALKQISQADQAKIELDSVMCSGCNLCADICFYQAIKLAERSAGALLAPIKTLAEGKETLF